MSSEPFKMMLGFVVRQCAADLGHAPNPAELADWANNQRDDRGDYCVFGRAISSREASVILRYPQRLVAVYGTLREGFNVPVSSADAEDAEKVIAFDPDRRTRQRSRLA